MSCSDPGNSDVIAAASAIAAAQSRSQGVAGLSYADLRDDFHRLKGTYRQSLGNLPASDEDIADALDAIAHEVDSDERIQLEDRTRILDRIEHTRGHIGTDELDIDQATLQTWRRVGTHEHLAMLRERQAARAQAQEHLTPQVDREFGSHTPEDAASKWAAATDEQRAHWMKVGYRSLGRTDGLPAAVRDRANRRTLAQDLEHAAEQLRALDRGQTVRGTPLTAERAARYRAEWEKKARILRTIDEEIDVAASRGIKAQLLRYSANDTGRAVVAMGDVDKAQHVAVLVPGMSTTVPRTLASHMRSAEAVAARARAFAVTDDGSQETVSAVAWIGYRAPQGVVGAAVPWRANKGGQDLRSNLRGIRAASDAAETDQHITLIGHSYGSLTAGKALRGRTGVDDVAFVGSPGVGAKRATDLQVNPDNVYVAQARGDIVALLGRYGDPMTEQFGAKVLSTAGDRTSHDNVELSEIRGHSDYYDAGSESLDNLAAVVAGRPHLARTQDHRTFAQWAGSVFSQAVGTLTGAHR